MAARALEEKLNADTSDDRGPWLSCDCGRSARYAGRRRKRFTSVLGPVVLERAYYHCVGCESGFYPRDRDLGLEGGSLTPGAVRMVGTAAARVSFAESSQLLAELAGLPIDPKRVERAAEALGGEIAEDECVRIESEPPSAPTMYLGMDGTGVPVRREETEGRAGKQPDGSAKTREVKLVTLWTAEALDPEGRPRRDPGSISYSAAIESAAARDTDPGLSAFARRVGREAERRGFGGARRRVVLGDGAAWIWNVTAEQFPEAIEIVDRYDAQEQSRGVAPRHYTMRESSPTRAAARRAALKLEASAPDRGTSMDHSSGGLLPAVSNQTDWDEEVPQWRTYTTLDRNRGSGCFSSLKSELGLRPRTIITRVPVSVGRPPVPRPSSALGSSWCRSSANWTVNAARRLLQLDHAAAHPGRTAAGRR